MTRTIEIIEQYLSEIWKPFDAEDESTWPKDTKAKIVLGEGHVDVGGFDNGLWFDFYGHRFNTEEVEFYLDPADILPKEGK